MGPCDLIKSRGIISRLKATSVLCKHIYDFQKRIPYFARETRLEREKDDKFIQYFPVTISNNVDSFQKKKRKIKSYTIV